ncbi:hypothetical protein [Nevskia sp.]|uniref:hypothetical protein n=1 Tax=Nevskia sp. TaxID=1929292 RepID=UPI0025D957E9|nr:hypothetical protein [Nevskia sp.]
MIIFLTTAAHGYTIKRYLEASAASLRRQVMTMSYGEFLSWRKLPAGHYIFADVDRLDADEAAAVARRIDHLAAALPSAVRLNDPRRLLGRLQLLNALQAAGINDFGARLSTAPIDGLRYPVFVRPLIEHKAGLTPLLHDATELRAALERLRHDGIDLSSCVTTEFIDVRNADGHYEKYSVLRIGDVFIASDHSMNDRWIVKGEDDEAVIADDLARCLAFQHANPHEAQLRPIFDRAGVDYGRVDYAFARGRLQVFEINPNPTLSPDFHGVGEYRRSTRLYNAMIADGLRALLAKPVGARGWLTVDGAGGAERVEAESRLRQLVRRSLRAIGLLRWEHDCARWRQALTGRRD